MKKVLLVLNGDHYSGAERVLDRLALHLPKFGYEPHFACLKDGLFGDSRDARDASLHSVVMRNRLDVSAVTRLKHLVRDEAIDLINTHTPRAVLPGAMVSALAGVPLVHHLHSPTFRCTNNATSNVVNTVVERVAAQRAKALIAVSNPLGEYLAGQKFPGKRIHVVLNGVEGTPGLPARTTPQGIWTIGVIARFRQRKGLDVLLKAVDVLRRGGHEGALKVIGPFERAEGLTEMRHLAESLGIAENIEWVGFTQDVGSQLQTLDLLVLPSTGGEGLPMVMLEAMGAGVPVVATAIDGVTEVICDGEDGLLSEAGSPGDLADKVVKFLDGTVSWESVRANAYRKQQAHYTDEAMAGKTADVFDKVLEVL